MKERYVSEKYLREKLISWQTFIERNINTNEPELRIQVKATVHAINSALAIIEEAPKVEVEE